ncbi:MAG: hypothetical protein QOH84_318 [Kribbellaceae bacterium]|nr:hypothetical protein [Kribbellaceae bacterium]
MTKLKCSLKPLDFRSYGITFSAANKVVRLGGAQRLALLRGPVTG